MIGFVITVSLAELALYLLLAFIAGMLMQVIFRVSWIERTVAAVDRFLGFDDESCPICIDSLEAPSSHVVVIRDDER